MSVPMSGDNFPRRYSAAVTGEDDQGHVIYNRGLIALAQHYRFQPRACRPYRAKTTDEIE